MARRCRSRWFGLLLAALVVGVGLAALASPAVAGTGIVRGVVNADGGVYWRGSPPDWNNPIRNPGYGVYNGDQIELECWTTGSVVPPYNNNTLWYDAKVVAGRGLGEGYVNDHFINTGINQPNIVVAGVPQCGAPPTPPAPQGLRYPVFNADGGIFFRSAPNWASSRGVFGDGVYNGDTVELICGAAGEAIGPYANTWWSYVRNLSRPNLAPGWLNEHYINDGAPSGQGPPGESGCPAGTPGLGAAPPTPAQILQPTVPGPVLQPAAGAPAAQPAKTVPTPGCYLGIRWKKRTLHFTYNGKHRYYGNAYQAAKNWTALGVGVKVLPAGAGDKADIVFADVNRKSLGYYASALLGTSVRDTHQTTVRANPGVPGTPDSPGVVAIAVNQVFMDRLDDPHKSYVLTHELGHALGLQHPGECGHSAKSVMREGGADVPNRTVLRPQSYDIMELEELYGR